jgi:hypothetical protein
MSDDPQRRLRVLSQDDERLIGALQRVFPIGKVESHYFSKPLFAEASAEPSPKFELRRAAIARRASRA